MAVPQFNIEDVVEFFKTADITFEISILSKYSPKPTYASFDRILNLRNIGKLEGKTNININNNNVLANIKVYPYRNGSMIKIVGVTGGVKKI
jgi:hypothetical protein